MKRFLSILMGVTLAACSSGSGASEPSEQMKEETAETQQAEETAGQSNTELTEALYEKAKDGMTIRMTEYRDGETEYTCDYALLSEKYCVDIIGGLHNHVYDTDIYRIVYNPDLYEMPVIWPGEPIHGNGILITTRTNYTAFLQDTPYLTKTGEMEYEGETYYFEEFMYLDDEFRRILYKDGEPVMIIFTDEEGNIYTEANGHQYYFTIDSIENTVDESLFDVEPGLDMYSSN